MQQSVSKFPSRTPEITEVGRRLLSQKGVLVHVQIGYVEPDDLINTPGRLKDALLLFLDRNHKINAAAMYSDLHGFIHY